PKTNGKGPRLRVPNGVHKRTGLLTARGKPGFLQALARRRRAKDRLSHQTAALYAGQEGDYLPSSILQYAASRNGIADREDQRGLAAIRMAGQLDRAPVNFGELVSERLHDPVTLDGHRHTPHAVRFTGPAGIHVAGRAREAILH